MISFLASFSTLVRLALKPYSSFSSALMSFISDPSIIFSSSAEGIAFFRPLTKSMGSNAPAISPFRPFRAVRLGLTSSLAICRME